MAPFPKLSDIPEYPRRRRKCGRWMIWLIPFIFLLATTVHFRQPARDFYDTVSTRIGDTKQSYFGPEREPDRNSPPSDNNLPENISPDNHNPSFVSSAHDRQWSSGTTPATASEPAPTSPTPIPDDIPIDHSNPRGRLPKEMEELMKWDPPVWATLHRPHYADFVDRDYDPNRWEGFEKNINFFANNTLTPSNDTGTTTASSSSEGDIAMPYAPYPDYNSRAWSQKWRGQHVSCMGMHGKPLNESQEEVVKAYRRKSYSIGAPDVGSFEAIGLDENLCFDRHSRFAHVGGVDGTRLSAPINLGTLQNQCLQRNKDRYENPTPPDLRPGVVLPESHLNFTADVEKSQQTNHTKYGPQYYPRTAVLIRSWENYDYEPNDIQAIRSLVHELSLQSGGEYTVFLFVNLKDENINIYDTPGYIDEKMEQIPDELRDMTILWNEKICADVYPDVGQYQVLLAQFMPVQWFMETHPEFEYVWNWEMDARYIGHHYHFTEKVSEFAAKQPRKLLWERNARFFLPKLHGSYGEFFNETIKQIQDSPFAFNPVWGHRHFDEPMVIGPTPPHSEESDNFEWGVGEEADFISLLPIWDPRHTTWGWKNAILHYPDPLIEVPRRAYINTHARYSRRLLRAMHRENLAGRLMVSELFPTTVALHHSLKAVYVPQPIWFTHNWPSYYADAVFNADGWGAGSFRNISEPEDDEINQELNHPTWGRGVAYNETLARLTLPQTGTGPNREGAMARWGQERDSVYNTDREHNFYGWSWYYASDFARMVYWRWLGWKQTFSVWTMGWQKEYDEFADVGTAKWERENGRLCFPGMLLHPVKNVKPPTEETEPELEEDLRRLEAGVKHLDEAKKENKIERRTKR